MSNQPSIKKNFILKMLYELLAIATPLITAPYISRILGADGVGIYSYSQSCMTYFTMFAVLGTNGYGTREIARCRNNKEEYSQKFWEIELLTVCTSTICIIAWLVLTAFSGSYKPYFIALLPTLFASMFDISWFYTGHERVGYTVFWNAVCKITGLICIFTFIKTRNDLVLYIFLNSVILMLGNLSMWVFLPKMLVKIDVKLLDIKQHFRETLIYFIPTIATSIYTVVDKTLIGVITNDSYQNGYYEQATKIINIAKTVCFFSLNSVVGARISFLFAENKIDEIENRIKSSVNLILFLSIGAMFGIVAVADEFVPLFFGKGYEPVVNLLILMSPLIPIIGISSCIGSHYYTPVGKTKNASYYMIAGSVCNLLLNILLIPRLGATGAVIGSIGAEFIITALFVQFDDKYITWKDIIFSSWKKIIAGLAMLFVIIVFSKYTTLTESIELILMVVIGVISYMLMLFILKDETIKQAVEMIKKRIGALNDSSNNSNI